MTSSGSISCHRGALGHQGSGVCAPPAESSGAVCWEHWGFAQLELILTFPVLPISRGFIATDVFPPSQPFVAIAELLARAQAVQQKRTPSCVSLGGLCLQWALQFQWPPQALPLSCRGSSGSCLVLCGSWEPAPEEEACSECWA